MSTNDEDNTMVVNEPLKEITSENKKTDQSENRRGRSRTRSNSNNNKSDHSKSHEPRNNKPDDESTKLFVRNLSRNVKEEHLKEIFGNYGTIKSVALITNKRTQQSKGYGFIEYEQHSEAAEALEYFGGGQLDGEIVSVTWYKGRETKLSQGNARRYSPEPIGRRRDTSAPYRRSRSPVRRGGGGGGGSAGGGYYRGGGVRGSPSPDRRRGAPFRRPGAYRPRSRSPPRRYRPASRSRSRSRTRRGPVNGMDRARRRVSRSRSPPRRRRSRSVSSSRSRGRSSSRSSRSRSRSSSSRSSRSRSRSSSKGGARRRSRSRSGK